jgi:hypothetical protein
MTEEHSKDLGKRALTSGMPWANRLVDGDDGHQILLADLTEFSWPDFRDPLTAAWLIAWASEWLQNNTEYLPSEWKDEPYGIDLVHSDLPEIQITAETRVEAWLLVIEKLKEDGWR